MIKKSLKSNTSKSHTWAPLKVHKNDNFFGFDFEFCTILMLVIHNNKILGNTFFDWTIMGGATIIPRSLRTTRNEKYFQDRPKIFYFLNYIYDP